MAQTLREIERRMRGDSEANYYHCTKRIIADALTSKDDWVRGYAAVGNGVGESEAYYEGYGARILVELHRMWKVKGFNQ